MRRSDLVLCLSLATMPYLDGCAKLAGFDSLSGIDSDDSNSHAGRSDVIASNAIGGSTSTLPNGGRAADGSQANMALGDAGTGATNPSVPNTEVASGGTGGTVGAPASRGGATTVAQPSSGGIAGTSRGGNSATAIGGATSVRVTSTGAGGGIGGVGGFGVSEAYGGGAASVQNQGGSSGTAKSTAGNPGTSVTQSGGSPGSTPSGGKGGTGVVGNAVAGAGFAGAGASRGCDAQLLTNADFEAGPLDWRVESNWLGIRDIANVIVSKNDPKLLQASFAPPAVGSYVAWLGGVTDSDSGHHIGLFQDVLVPSEATEISLSGRIQIKTEEPGVSEYDTLVAQLEDANDAWLFDPKPGQDSIVWSNRDATTGWIDFDARIVEESALRALRGRLLSLRIESRNDPKGITSFWFDSLRLVATCAR